MNQWLGYANKEERSKGFDQTLEQIKGILALLKVQDNNDVIALSFNLVVRDGRMIGGNEEENVFSLDFGDADALCSLLQDSLESISPLFSIL